MNARQQLKKLLVMALTLLARPATPQQYLRIPRLPRIRIFETDGGPDVIATTVYGQVRCDKSVGGEVNKHLWEEEGVLTGFWILQCVVSQHKHVYQPLTTLFPSVVWCGGVGVQVKGIHDEATNVTAFRRIPFAAPPVGPLR